VASKAKEILERLKEMGSASFRLLFRGSHSRSEVVATFIAVLELCKDHAVRLTGGEADCTVTPTEEAGDRPPLRDIT
jgi:segregation and condensation protein A